VDDPPRSPYEYAVIRVVPRVERGELVNVGIVLFCKERRFLAVGHDLDERRLRALDPALDVDAVRDQLAAMDAVASGADSCGALAQLTQAERFRWLVSPRSTVVQTSPVHLGECLDPTDELRTLLRDLVSLTQH
jgi:hypothetical protein